jgi:competence protein ComEC
VDALYHVGVSKTEQQRLITLFLLLGMIVWSWLPRVSFSVAPESSCECLQVSFLDVGQGDAILIQTPDGFEMLVDGGRDSSVLRELGKVRNYFDKEIDMVVATHPDLDHVAGLVDVLQRYEVGTILMTTNEGDSSAAVAFAAAAPQEGAEIILADAGQVFQLGASTTIQVFAPTGDESKLESNAASIVIRVVYGETSFMLTGDAPMEIENYLVATYSTQLDSDVLKLGHHGSKTSTSDKWLDTVTPQFAVVSAGLDNRYGHPHQVVMQRVFKRNIQTSHTGTDGTVIFQSDGQTVWRK